MVQARDAMLAADLGPLRRREPGPALAGLRVARLRPVPEHDGARRTRTRRPTSRRRSANNATLNFFADTAREARSSRSTRRSTSATTRRVSTQIADTNPSTNPSATPGTNNLDNTAQFVPNTQPIPRLELRTTSSRWRPASGAVRFSVRSLQARRGPQHHDPLRSELRLVVARRDGHRRRTRDEHEPRERARRRPRPRTTARRGAPVAGRWFVIALGDVGPNGANVKRLGVSAQLIPATGGNRPTTGSRRCARSTRYACRAGKNAANPTCDGSIDAGWTKIVSSASDAFPSVNPGLPHQT